MNQQQIKERFLTFENLLVNYDFFLKTMHWLYEHFFNQKLCKVVICYHDSSIKKVEKENIEKMC